MAMFHLLHANELIYVLLFPISELFFWANFGTVMTQKHSSVNSSKVFFPKKYTEVARFRK
jgi:hypothetical protein